MAGGNLPNPGKSIPDAYHGTDSVSAEGILNSGFQSSTGEKQFLGDGVYFFESAPDQAERWAKRRCRALKRDTYAVLRATIQLGRCLDYLDGRCKALLNDAAQRLEERGRKVTDATVISFLAQIHPFDSVRAVRQTQLPGTIFAQTNFPGDVQLIVCVRSKANIGPPQLVRTGRV